MNRTTTLIASAGIACACTTAMAQHRIMLENSDMTADDRLQRTQINCAGLHPTGCGKTPRFAELGWAVEFVPGAGPNGVPRIIGSSPYGDNEDFPTDPCGACIHPFIRSFTPGTPGCTPLGAPYGLVGRWEAQGTTYPYPGSTRAGVSMDLLIREGEDDPILLVGAPETVISGSFDCGDCGLATEHAWGAVRLINARTGCDVVNQLSVVAPELWIDSLFGTDGCGEPDSTLGWRSELYCDPALAAPRPIENLGSTVRWAHSDGEGNHYFIAHAPNGWDKSLNPGVGRFYVAKWDPSATPPQVTTQYVRYGGAGGATPDSVSTADFIVEDFDSDGIQEVVILQTQKFSTDREIFVAQYDPTETPIGLPCSPGTSLFEAPRTKATDLVTASFWPQRGASTMYTATFDLNNTLDMTTFGLGGNAFGGKAIESMGDVDCDGVPDFVIGLNKPLELDSGHAGFDYLAVGLIMSYDPSLDQFVGKTLLALPLDRPGVPAGYVFDPLPGGDLYGSMRSFSALSSQDPTIREVVVGFGGGNYSPDPDEDSAIRLRYTDMMGGEYYVSVDAAVFDVRDGHLRREFIQEDEAVTLLPATLANIVGTVDFNRQVGSGVAIGDMNDDGVPDYILSDPGRDVGPRACPIDDPVQSGRIYVSYACAADYNGDGVVDSTDLDDLSSDYGASRPAADFNRDCVIDSVDVMDFYAFYLPASSSGCP